MKEMAICDNCKEEYERYNILCCDNPKCISKVLKTKMIYGKKLCNKCLSKLQETII